MCRLISKIQTEFGYLFCRRVLLVTVVQFNSCTLYANDCSICIQHSYYIYRIGLKGSDPREIMKYFTDIGSLTLNQRLRNKYTMKCTVGTFFSILLIVILFSCILFHNNIQV